MPKKKKPIKAKAAAKTKDIELKVGVVVKLRGIEWKIIRYNPPRTVLIELNTGQKNAVRAGITQKQILKQMSQV